MELGAGADVTPPRAQPPPEHQTKMIQTERLVQRASAAPMLSPCAGAPGSAATSRRAILCLFRVFLIQSYSAPIRSLCSLSFPARQWQHTEGCLGCVSCTHTLGKGCLGSPLTRAHRAGGKRGGKSLVWSQPAQQGQGIHVCCTKPSGGDFSWCAGTEAEEQHLLAVYPFGFLQGMNRGLD